MKTVHLISGGDAGGARTHVLRLLGELNKTGQAQLLCLGGGVLADSARERGIPCETLTGGFFCAASRGEAIHPLRRVRSRPLPR